MNRDLPEIAVSDWHQDDFRQAFSKAAAGAYMVNLRNGWWDDRNAIIQSGMPNALPIVVIGCLGLVTSEASEAMEAARKQPMEAWGDCLTKDTLVRELAGTVVRCMDLAERLNLPLASAIIEEIKANAERGHKHGGKAA